MFEKQRQSAGDNSNQIQVNGNIVMGISEERARAIVDEKLEAVLQAYSTEAHSLATERVNKFADDLIPKLVKLNLLESLKDPSIQLLLAEAQKTAASTEREVDDSLLSELLIHRINKGSDRKIRAGISQAVEIVDEIADEALLALTVCHCVSRFTPVSGLIADGLSVLDSLFGKIIYSELPQGSDWIEHLDILNAVRISSFGSMKKVSQFCTDKFPGYIDVGIKCDSEAHTKAKEIIANNALPNGILIPHELCNEYMRIPISNKVMINQLSTQIIASLESNGKVIPSPINVPFNEAQQVAVNELYSLYENNANLRQENITKFMEKWDAYANLLRLKGWWDSLPISFNITSVGKVLAHANAQRCDPTLPPID
jgi:hypothetical protein